MDDRTKWNSKYKERMQERVEPEANPRLVSLSSYLNGGAALDLACGLGGNSLFLARNNYRVKALDISDIAINSLQEKAELKQLAIDAHICDLTDMNNLYFVDGSFDLIVVTYYLDRTLFPISKAMIKDGGCFFMETYFKTPASCSTRVSDRFKLNPKELRTEFEDWNILFYEENEREGIQTIFCRKP